MTAEQCLLRGMMAWRSAEVATYAPAMSCLARAIDLRPDLVPAYAEAIEVMNGARTYDLGDALGAYYSRLPCWIETGRRFAGQSALLDLSIAIADYWSDHKPERLAAALRQIIQRAPLDARLLTFAGWTYNWSGQAEMALDCFRTALRLGRFGSTYVAAAAGAATACVMLGRDREAIGHANAGLRFADGYPALHSTRAAAHAMLGEPDRAAEALIQLLRIEPGETVANRRSVMDNGDGPGARRYFEGLRRAGMPES